MKKKVVSLVMIATMLMSMTACGGGTAKRDENQTDFTVVGGQSALSPGYDDNEVLNKLLKEQGINITWNTMSDSLEEQVNIQIAGGDLPDAYMGVGFSNYDLATYGDDGTFIDLTDYINAAIAAHSTN